MTIYYATGFQHGAPVSQITELLLAGGTASYNNTSMLFGDRCISLAGSLWDYAYLGYKMGTPGPAYLSFWHRTSGGGGSAYVSQIQEASGGVIATVFYDESRFQYILTNGSNVQQAYTDNSFFNAEWHHVEIGANGSAVSFYIDGKYIGGFTSSKAVGWLFVFGRPAAGTKYASFFNSFVVSSERVGDLRFARYVPSADVSVQFTPSTGTSNYACVDEVPPSTTDYVSAAQGSSAKADLYETSGNAIAPTAQVAFVAVHVYANVSEASPLDLHINVGDGYEVETFNTVNPADVNAKLYTAISEHLPNSSGGWSVAAIENLQIGFGIDALV